MLIEHMGERPIAITIIVRSVYMLILIPVFGYGATANTLTSRLIGEQRQPEIMSTLRRIEALHAKRPSRSTYMLHIPTLRAIHLLQ